MTESHTPGSYLTKLSALELARRVRAREVSPVAVVEAHLAMIARANPVVNAVCTLAADHALEAAHKLEADLASGRPVGPLAGVPVGIKDITPTAGIRTTYGSTLYADNVPTEDALIVTRLKEAGAIVIGKTNTPEFAAGANTYNAVFGATRNPWNPDLSASGSTGGGAAGLRCGMFPLAEGSDLGGSLRTPAAFCGVVGIRPSPGLVPKWPTVAPWDVLSVAGPMARSVADTAAMLQAISGPSPYSPLIVPTQGRDFVAAARAGIKPGMRIAYCADTSGIGVDTEVERVCRAAAFELQAAGATVEEIDLDLSVGRAAFLQLRGQYQLSRHLDRLGRIDKMGPNLAGNIRLGLAQSPRDLVLGERGQAQILETMRKFFERYDCLLTPCTSVPPFPVERNFPETINGQPMKTYIDWVAPTFVITLAGLPAVSVPCGFTADNMPVGLQVVGPRWGEEVALGVASAVEAVHPVGFPGFVCDPEDAADPQAAAPVIVAEPAPEPAPQEPVARAAEPEIAETVAEALSAPELAAEPQMPAAAPEIAEEIVAERIAAPAPDAAPAQAIPAEEEVIGVPYICMPAASAETPPQSPDQPKPRRSLFRWLGSLWHALTGGDRPMARLGAD